MSTSAESTTTQTWVAKSRFQSTTTQRLFTITPCRISQPYLFCAWTSCSALSWRSEAKHTRAQLSFQGIIIWGASTRTVVYYTIFRVVAWSSDLRRAGMLGGVMLNGLLGDPEQHGARILEFDMS